MTALLQRKGENDRRKYFMINLQERMLPTLAGSNPPPPGLQSDAHPTEPPRLVEKAIQNYHNNPKYWDRQAFANSVDPDQTLQQYFKHIKR